MWRLEISSLTWTRLYEGTNNPPPSPVYTGSDATPGARIRTTIWVTQNGLIYIFGGQHKDSAFNDVWNFNGSAWYCLSSGTLGNTPPTYPEGIGPCFYWNVMFNNSVLFSF